MLAKLKNREDIAKNVFSLTFDLQGKELVFQAGQFFSLTLQNPPYTDNRGNSRFLGIMNSPLQKDIISTATRVGKSAFKRFLKEMPIGTEVAIDKIGGHQILPVDRNKALVFIPCGIGIVPFMGLLHHMQLTNIYYQVTIFYQNETQEETPFLSEIQSLAKEHQEIKFVPIMTSDSGWSGEKRQFSPNIIKEYVEEPEGKLYMLAGPVNEVMTATKTLKEAGIPEDKIQFEIFTGY